MTWSIRGDLVLLQEAFLDLALVSIQSQCSSGCISSNRMQQVVASLRSRSLRSPECSKAPEHGNSSKKLGLGRY